MPRSISETTKILHQNPYHNMVTIKVIELKRPYWQSAKNLLGTYLLISKMTKCTKNLLTVWWQLRSLNFERLCDANLLKIYLVFDAILTTLRWQKKLIIWNTKLWKCKIEVRSSCQNFPLHCGNLTAILLIVITLRRSSTQWFILKNLIRKIPTFKDSCNKITTTKIQISLQNWNGFFSISHQMTI